MGNAARTVEFESVTDAVFIKVRRFQQYGCHLLDKEDFEAWLAGCADDFQYTIQAYSPEIRRDVVLLAKDRDGMRLLFAQLPMHERYKGSLRRLLGWTVTDAQLDRQMVVVESGFSVHHTDVYGTTSLYCTGRYVDEIRMDGGSPLLSARTVLMDTRRLPFGSHVPI